MIYIGIIIGNQIIFRIIAGIFRIKYLLLNFIDININHNNHPLLLIVKYVF